MEDPSAMIPGHTLSSITHPHSPLHSDPGSQDPYSPSVCAGPMFACVQKSRVFVPTGASDSAGLSKDSASYLVSLHRHTQTLRERDSGAERERERVLSERSIGHFRGFCF